MTEGSPASRLEVKVGLSGQYLIVDAAFEDAWLKTDTVVPLPVDDELDRLRT